MTFTASSSCACGRPKSGAAESWPISTMPRRMARVRVKCSNSASPSLRRMARVSFDRSSLKVPSISSTASLLARNTSRHIVGSEAAMRVKSRKPPAENFITSDECHLRQFVGGADDGVGDQMRQMAGDRQHEVVMIRRHDLDLGAEPGPERAQLFDRGGIGAFRRRQDAPAVDEQFGEAGIGTGMLGAGDRMRRHEVDALRADAAPCRARSRP